MAEIITVAAITLLVWSLAFLYFRNYLKRRTGSERILLEFREEVEKLISEINAATDRDLTLVEDRIRTLRTLLEDTDKRIVTYKQELERRRIQENAYAELGKKMPVNTGVSGNPPGELPGGNSPGAKKDGGAAPDTAPPADNSQPRPGENGKSRNNELSSYGPRFVRSSIKVEPKAPPFSEQVIQLSRAGFSAELIASRLGSTVTEVELVIALAGRSNEGEG